MGAVAKGIEAVRAYMPKPAMCGRKIDVKIAGWIVARIGNLIDAKIGRLIVVMIADQMQAEN